MWSDLEDQVLAIRRNLPQAPESERFEELVREGHIKALAISFAVSGVSENASIGGLC
jgi:hypothetical protein